MNIIEWLRVIFLGIVEGITEWLPVSSTGHLILVDAFWKTSAPEVFTAEFTEMFDVVIQLGAILAVVTVFFYKLNPFSARKTKEQKHNTIELWKKVIIGCIPAGVIGILFNDLIDKYLMNWLVVAIMLIVVGIAFIAIEMRNQKVRPSIVKFTQLSYKTAFIIGVFQLLALIPGTSRSGITIIGGMLFGCSRFIAAEYTFYLAIPVMFGASGLKLVKFLVKGGGFSAEQFFVVLLAMVVSYFEVCMVANDYMNPRPLLLMTLTEIIFIVPWVCLVRKFYQWLYPPRQMLVIYGNYSPDDLIDKINTRKDKYNICAAQSYRIGYEKLYPMIQKYNAVLLCDLPSEARNQIMKYCYQESIRTYVTPKISDILFRGADDIHLFDTPLLLSRNQGLGIVDLFIKRIMDIVISLIGIVIASPFMLLIVLAIKLYDHGPILYKQERQKMENRL